MIYLICMVELVIVTGPICGGKNTAAKYLCNKHNFYAIDMGDLLAREVKRRKLNLNRRELYKALPKLPEGQITLVKRAIEIIKNHNPAKACVVGERQKKALDLWKSKHPNLKLILVTADAQVRFERALARNRSGDFKAFDVFCKEEQKEFDSHNMQAVFDEADYVIENNRSLTTLFSLLDKIV